MVEAVKKRLGIAVGITIYDEEITSLVSDALADMRLSGVPPSILEEGGDGVKNAVTLYVKAYFGNDRTDTKRYLELYRKKVFRLSLEDGAQEEEGA
jgi:hypothetical protein